MLLKHVKLKYKCSCHQIRKGARMNNARHSCRMIFIFGRDFAIIFELPETVRNVSYPIRNHTREIYDHPEKALRPVILVVLT